jgi:hypothetical protein
VFERGVEQRLSARCGQARWGRGLPKRGIARKIVLRADVKPAPCPAIFRLTNERIKEFTEQASSLPPIERAEQVILQSLDRTDADLDRLWGEEAKDRLGAYSVSC